MRGRLGKPDIIDSSLEIEWDNITHDGKVLVVNGKRRAEPQRRLRW